MPSSCNIQHHIEMDGTIRQIDRFLHSNHQSPKHKPVNCKLHHHTLHLPTSFHSQLHTDMELGDVPQKTLDPYMRNR